jgi:predicted GNAT family N-acyltransferase
MIRWSSLSRSAVSFQPVTWGSCEYKKMLELRDLVLRKPLGRSVYNDDLESEKAVHLYVAAHRDCVIGSAYLIQKSPQTLQLKQMAIHPDFQRLRIGADFVKYLEDEAIKSGAAEIYLHARDVALPFYRKQGYEVIGDAFLEVGISHHEMRKLLPVR